MNQKNENDLKKKIFARWRQRISLYFSIAWLNWPQNLHVWIFYG